MKWFDIADELLPPVYRAIKDMYAYAKALNGEFKVWIYYMESILNNFFIQKCDTKTIEFWEALLEIIPPQGETLDERREYILEQLNNTTPTTEPVVRKKIERMFEGDDYRLWFDVDNGNPYDLNIDIFTTDEDALSSFKRWLYKMCPAHIYPSVTMSMETTFDRPLVINHAHYSSLSSSLGLVAAKS